MWRTCFFSALIFAQWKGHSKWALLLITSSVLKPLERHLTCKLHSPRMEFQKKKSLKLSHLWSFDRTSHCHFWQTKNEVFWEFTHTPPRTRGVGWAGREFKTKRLHPPSPHFLRRARKQKITNNQQRQLKHNMTEHVLGFVGFQSLDFLFKKNFRVCLFVWVWAYQATQ